MSKLWIVIAGLLGAGAVTIGGYHAHGLEKLLEKRYVRGEDDAEWIPETSRLYRESADLDKNGRMGGKEIAAHIEYLMHNCDSAVKYQFYHALGILGAGILLTRSRGFSGFLLSAAALAMLLGVLGFSGGLYCTVFDIARLHWSIVPLGGLLMILGWIVLAIAGLFVTRESATELETK